MGSDTLALNLVGQFEAHVAVKFFNGVPVEKLPQLLIDPPYIVINLNSAKNIGYNIPFNLMNVVEEIIE